MRRTQPAELYLYESEAAWWGASQSCGAWEDICEVVIVMRELDLTMLLKPEMELLGDLRGMGVEIRSIEFERGVIWAISVGEYYYVGETLREAVREWLEMGQPVRS